MGCTKSCMRFYSSVAASLGPLAYHSASQLCGSLTNVARLTTLGFKPECSVSKVA